MNYYNVRNWRKFQHYSDRNPPWIKLHYEILSSKDWVMLADASKVIMIACMLIASRNDGQIPDDPDFIARVAYLKNVNLKPLVDIGFLVSASTCKQILADARPETETETETETDQINPPISPQGGRVKAVRKKPSGLTPDKLAQFNRWYFHYPRKEGTGAALTSWGKHTFTNEQVDAMIETIKAHKKKWALRPNRYTPMPATYLNQERWLDVMQKELGEDFNPQDEKMPF